MPRASYKVRRLTLDCNQPSTKNALQRTVQQCARVRGNPREISAVTVNAPTSNQIGYVANGYRSDTKLLYFTSCLIHSLTPWSRVLLEKLTDFQLIQKFLAFHGTRWFITAFTSARHLSLSSASSIQPMSPNPTYWRYILTFRRLMSTIVDVPHR